MKRTIALLLTIILVFGMISSALAETVNEYVDEIPRVTKKINENVSDNLKVVVEKTTSGSYTLNLPQLTDTEAVLSFRKNGEEVSGNDSFDSVDLLLFSSEEYDLTEFSVFATTMIYLSNTDITESKQARAILDEVIATVAKGDSHYDRNGKRYYLAASDSILFFAVSDLEDIGKADDASSVPASGADGSDAFKSIDLDKLVVDLSKHTGEEFVYETGCVRKETNTIGSISAVFSGVSFKNMPDKRINLFSPTGKAITDILTISDQKIIAQFDDISGYEWKGIHVRAEFHDNHAINYNSYLLGVFADYYSGEVYDRNAKEYGNYVYGDFSIVHKGNTYNDCRLVTYFKADFNSKGDNYDIYVYYRLPEGYDGATVGFANTNGYRFTSGYEDNQDSLEEQFANGGVIFRLN